MKTTITIEVEVEYTISKGSRGSRDSLGGARGAGPPLEPDEPAEVEITSVRIDGSGCEIADMLCSDTLSEIEDACFEDASGHSEEDRIRNKNNRDNDE